MAQLHVTAEEIAAALTGPITQRMDAVVAELRLLNRGLFGADAAGGTQPISTFSELFAELRWQQLQMLGYDRAGAQQAYNFLGVLSFALYADALNPVDGATGSRSLAQIVRDYSQLAGGNQAISATQQIAARLTHSTGGTSPSESAAQWLARIRQELTDTRALLERQLENSANQSFPAQALQQRLTSILSELGDISSNTSA